MSKRNGVQPRRKRPLRPVKELRLRRIIASLPMHVVALDASGRVTHASGAPRQTGGHSAVPGTTRLGSCYTSNLREAACAGDIVAAQLHEGLLAVLRGERNNFHLEYQRQLDD